MEKVRSKLLSSRQIDQGPYSPDDFAGRQRGGERVHAFTAEDDIGIRAVSSNTFEMEWPPKSGRLQTFPEIDRTERLDLRDANEKVLASQ